MSNEALQSSLELAKSKVPPFCLFPPINLNPLPCSIFCLTLSSTLGGTFLASEGEGLNGPQELKKVNKKNSENSLKNEVFFIIIVFKGFLYLSCINMIIKNFKKPSKIGNYNMM